MIAPESCFGPDSGPVDSYTARYLLIEPGYTVLKAWKKHGGPLFDRIILKADASFFSPKASVIVPVPQNFQRSWQLGRSPAEIVARWISRREKVPFRSDLLQTSNSSVTKRRQAQLGLEQRLQSRSTFVATPEAYRLSASLSSVILVDDFMTSGRTLKSAAMALRDAGFRSVHAFVLGYRPSQAQTEGAEAKGSAEVASETANSVPVARRAVST